MMLRNKLIFHPRQRVLDLLTNERRLFYARSAKNHSYLEERIQNHLQQQKCEYRRFRFAISVYQFKIQLMSYDHYD
jgi:hypothetical protein